MMLLKALKPDDGHDVVTQWFAEHARQPKVRAGLDNRMLYLKEQPRDGWTRNQYDTLKEGVGEVRFKVERIQYRALGYFGPGRNEFTFLLFATKTNRFDPPKAIEIAIARKDLVAGNPNLAVKLKRWGQI